MKDHGIIVLFDGFLMPCIRLRKFGMNPRSTFLLPEELKKLEKKTIGKLVIIFGLLPGVLRAQSATEQLWFEYIVNYSFANSYNLENAFKYSMLLDTPRWYAFDFTPTLDRSLTNHIDIS